MRVAAVTALGGPEVIQAAEWPDPVAGPGQVLVRVRAACVNPADIAVREGYLPGTLEPPFLPGWDIAGEVAATGDGVTGFAVGDRVAGMIPWFETLGKPGGYAEFVAADEAWLVPVPDGLDLAAASTVPLNALTAHQALAMLAPPEGATLLVTGASGGVGGFAAELAVRAGLRVLAVAGRDDEGWVRGLGVDSVLPRSADLAAIGPVPAVLDAVPVGPAAGAAVADGGALVTTRPTAPVEPHRGVRQQVVRVRLDRPALAELVRDLAEGRLHTRVAEELPLAGAARAHHRAEAGGLHGKVVLRP